MVTATLTNMPTRVGRLKFRLALLLVTVLTPAVSMSQSADIVNERSARLLFRPGYGYQDYSREGYRRTGRQVEERLTSLQYDEFGTLLMDGLQLYDLRQVHPMPDAVNTPAREPGSSLQKSLFYNDYLNRLFIASDSYGSSQFKVIVGDRIRTRFSPLTLDQAMLNGIRIDGQVRDHEVSLIASRIDRPIFRYEGIFGYEQAYFGDVRAQPGLTNSVLATYLMGGHYHTRLGPFDLGVTYANQYRIDTQVGLAQNSLKGSLPVQEVVGVGPTARPSAVEYLVVKVADESPRSAGGALVYDIDILINGQHRADIVPTVTRHDTRVDAVVRTNRDVNGDRFFPDNRTIPPFVEFLVTPPVAEPNVPGQPLEAEGTEYLLYWFAIPADDNREISFRARVANDYELSISEVYVADVTSTEARQRYGATYFQRAAWSPGRVRDGSNLRDVTFDYGRQTGITVAGVHLKTELTGFLLDMEVVRNYDFRQYPGLGGERSDLRSNAYYAVARKEVDRISLGGEVFSVPADFSTTLSVQQNNFTTDYTGPFLNEVSNTFNTRYNNTIEFDLVEDNDDRDPFPDDHFLASVRDSDGVYPGLDEDFDGRPDTNRNSNGIPDYSEAFLLYHIDPDAFAYGADFNNNGQIDLREDDDKPDYPYDRDLRGYHAFLGSASLPDTKVHLGLYRAHQLAGGGIMRTAYAELTHQLEGTWGSIQVANFLKRVRDTIADDTFRYGADRTFGSLPVVPPDSRTRRLSERDLLGTTTSYVPDPMHFRNSVANTAFLEWRLRVGDLSLRGSGKYEANFQRRTHEQGANRIDHVTSVLAADYSIARGGLEVNPRAKLQVELLDDEVSVVLPVSQAAFYPMLTAKYALTPMTQLKAGAQGFPFLPCPHRDFENASLDYASEDYVAMVTSVTDYMGYILSFNVGYQIRHERMRDRSRRAEDIDYALFFVRVLTALRPSEGR